MKSPDRLDLSGRRLKKTFCAFAGGKLLRGLFWRLEIPRVFWLQSVLVPVVLRRLLREFLLEEEFRQGL